MYDLMKWRRFKLKKLFVLFVALFTLVAFAACNGTTTAAPTTAAPTTAAPTTQAPREFAADGEFTAYVVAVHSNAPQVTFVTVTIENDQIVGFFIDCIQGRRTYNEETERYSFAFNAQSKKDLGFEYKMHWGAYAATDETPTIEEYQAWLTANSKLEWFEQANLIEAAWLANGFDSLTVNETNVIDNVAGVTIKDGSYITLAAQAVQLAKDGHMQAIYTSGTDLYSATMTVDADGNFSELLIDVLQGRGNATEGTFAWDAQTKQEKGYEYKMHWNSGYLPTDDTPTIEEYQAWLVANSKLEWFEQVALITDYVTANGWNGNLAALNDRSGTIDGTTAVDSLVAVTIRSQGYYNVLANLFGNLPE